MDEAATVEDAEEDAEAEAEADEVDVADAAEDGVVREDAGEEKNEWGPLLEVAMVLARVPGRSGVWGGENVAEVGAPVRPPRRALATFLAGSG